MIIRKSTGLSTFVSVWPSASLKTLSGLAEKGECFSVLHLLLFCLWGKCAMANALWLDGCEITAQLWSQKHGRSRRISLSFHPAQPGSRALLSLGETPLLPGVQGLPEGLASMTKPVVGELPGLPSVHCRVKSEVDLVTKTSLGEPGDPAGQREESLILRELVTPWWGARPRFLGLQTGYRSSLYHGLHPKNGKWVGYSGAHL